MTAVAAAEGTRRVRLRYITERRGFLATLLVSPAVLLIAALVGGPLGLAAYLSFTDAQAGSLTGKWVGLANFRHALHDPIFRGALWHTFLFTVISQIVVIFCAGLIAHAFVRRFRGRWALRFFILLPWAAPIALTVIGFLWFYDPQASIFTWFLVKLHLVSAVNHPTWLGTPRAAMSSIITVQAWRTIPFATVIVFAATDMIVPYILTNGGPFNSTQVLTTYAFQTGINAGNIGEGAAIALFMLPLLAVVVIGMLVFARRAEVT